MKTLCYSVRLLSLGSISAKAYKATGFDGSTAIIPKSQVFGMDYSVLKSDAYWISAWILSQKSLQYSDKKKAWFNPLSGRIEANFEVTIEKHIPTKKDFIKTEPDDTLTR